MTPKLRAGDLVVRKFFKAVVWTFDGTAVARIADRDTYFRFKDEAGDLVWESSKELVQPRLYSIVPMPPMPNFDVIRRRAQAIAKIAAARLGR